MELIKSLEKQIDRWVTRKRQAEIAINDLTKELEEEKKKLKELV
jgi:hypothetical protein|tara:strand:+ start:666 stop:797 length:132 start_codon:yes stop_codon:yes gene_type:complete